MPDALLSACDAERMDDEATVPLQTLPAVFAYKRHKAHRSDLRLLQLVTATGEHVQGLFFPIAKRNKNTSSVSHLLLVRGRNFGGAGADEYRAPERFREDLLEAMKKKSAQAPEGYDDLIKRYYEELVK